MTFLSISLYNEHIKVTFTYAELVVQYCVFMLQRRYTSQQCYILLCCRDKNKIN